MYGRILNSLHIVNLLNLYRGMFKLKLKINVKLPQLLCIVVSVALNGELERFGGFCVDCDSPFRATETTIHNNLACSRLSVSRDGQKAARYGATSGVWLLDPACRPAPRLTSRAAFRSSPLTESLEEATTEAALHLF